MKTGDHLQDGNGRTFQVGQLLGRGLWGKCYLAREGSDGAEWVIKVPLGDDDLPHDPPRLAEACREIAREQGRLLEEAGNDALVEIETRFIADDGSPTLLMPRYPETLERRLADMASLDEVLHVLTATLDALKTLAPVLPAHGGIKPSNILIDANGGIRVMDPVTPTLRRWLPVLAAREGYIGDVYLPPEVRAVESDPPITPAADTFALAMTLYRASTVDADSNTPPTLPTEGLKKGDVQALKDRIHNRLKGEPSNPRFHGRLADRAAAIINRAISVETSPSPPYRFNKISEFRKRLDEVEALVHPAIVHVGKLILNRPPATDNFSTDEDVRFSCTVGASQGVETHEEIGAGIAVFDQERNERLRNLACSYTVDRHPSGRFRFSFRIADLPPGQYTARVAYTIRDSGHEPTTAEEQFRISAAPGYVPPRAEPERQPIAIERDVGTTGTAENTVTAEFHPPGLGDPPEAEQENTLDSDAQVTPLHPTEADNSREIEFSPLPNLPDSYHTEPTEQMPGQSQDIEPVPVPIDRGTTPPLPGPSVEGAPEGEEPEYQGAGRWSELPLPNAGAHELPPPKAPRAPPKPKHEHGDQGPVAEMFGRTLSMIRSDAYLMFLGAAGLVILILLGALWLLPSS
jgi:hypothetical protein